MGLPDIYIAIPTVRDWKAEFGVSMIGLTHRLCQLSKDGKIRGFYVNNKITSNLPKGRQQMLDDAIDGEFTHILWIDDDTQFDASCLEIMLSRNKPWVAANICKKVMGGGWIAAYDGGGKVDSTGKSGIEKVGTMGLGFTLIELEPIRAIKKPHFEFRWVEQSQQYLGEDLYFALKARQHGIDIWIDHDASNKIRHVGNYGYGAQDLTAENKEEAA